MMLGANALGWAYLGQGYAGSSVPTPPPVVGARPGHLVATDPGKIVRATT